MSDSASENIPNSWIRFIPEEEFPGVIQELLACTTYDQLVEAHFMIDYQAGKKPGESEEEWMARLKFMHSVVTELLPGDVPKATKHSLGRHAIISLREQLELSQAIASVGKPVE